MHKKDHIICSACGKEIKLGEIVYRVEGLIYKCCSPSCLLSAVQYVVAQELTQELIDEE